MSSPSKMLTVDTNFFPTGSNYRPLRMPSVFYDDIEELDLIDISSMDLTVENEERWLSGPVQEKKPRMTSMNRSASLGGLTQAGLFDDVDPAEEARASTPRHSTPVGKENQRNGSGMANGDGVHMNGAGCGVSPIRHDTSPSPSSSAPSAPSPTSPHSNETIIHAPSAAANRTFGREEDVSPDENSKPLNRTHERLPEVGAGGERLPEVDAGGKEIPRVAPSQFRPTKQSTIPPPGGRIGLRPPSRAPVTMASKGAMNRTSSMGNLSSGQKMSACPPRSTTTTTNSLNGGNGYNGSNSSNGGNSSNSGNSSNGGNGGAPLVSGRQFGFLPNGARTSAVPPMLNGGGLKTVPGGSRLLRPSVPVKMTTTTALPAPTASGIPSRIPAKLVKKV